MTLTIKEYNKIINNIEEDYKKIDNIHQQYKSKLKKYSSDEIISVNFQSNTSVEDLKNDFDYFEKWYLKLFKQLKKGIDTYEEAIKDYGNIEDAYNYKNAVDDISFFLINLIHEQYNSIKDVIIDEELMNIKEYMNCLEDLSKNIESLSK